METQTTSTFSSRQEQTADMLHELEFPSHRLGYKQLCTAIPRFSTDDTQSLTKDLYPYLAKHYAYLDWRAPESAIRDVIVAVWEERDPVVWEKYFPNLKKAPSNKQFIATLAERLK